MKPNRISCRLLASITFLLFCFSCQEEPVDTTVKDAIAVKYKALGWDTQNTTATGDAVKTKGDKGWVQYYTYNGRKRAIYYYPETGAFGFEPEIAQKYNELGEETFRDNSLGLPKSDTKTCYGNCIYADSANGIIIKSTQASTPVTVYGAIYEKYASLKKWEGILGYPATDELELTGKRGRYNVFKAGQIYWSASTGAQAFWTKMDVLYKNAGYDTGWLGLPKTSCDPTKVAQVVDFEKGVITLNALGCGNYLKSGLSVKPDGNPIGHNDPTCY